MTDLSQFSKKNVYANWLRQISSPNDIWTNMLLSCACIQECRLQMLGTIELMFAEVETVSNILFRSDPHNVNPGLMQVRRRAHALSEDYIQILQGDTHVRK